MKEQLTLGINGTTEFKKIGELQCINHYINIDQTVLSEIRETWSNSFNPFTSSYSSIDISLREPQTGAIHSGIAHWTTSIAPATIIMPTGTGKTETMLSMLLTERCEKLLVVVPSDPLRNQTFEKFLNLGILPKLKGFNSSIKYPIVGKILHVPKSKVEVDELFDKCNVLIGIPTSLSRVPDDILEYIAEKVSHLFIDEAHHMTAPQWHRFKSIFAAKKKKILQFTATPFRNDNRPIEGKTIYNYPLKLSYSQGYFKKIYFKEVLEWDISKSDSSIARKAIELLKEDLGTKYNYDHLILARAENINRADDIHKIYSSLGSEFNPQLIHSGLTLKEKNTRLQLIKERKSRIIVCVDMFGEGFDLPNLKIAALHDVHKSLPITLQFTGRFARTVASSQIGDAKVVANIALTDVSEALQQLYSQDADWNEILEYQSDAKIKKQIGLEEFIESFAKGNYEEISLQNLRPKMSTVVFKMKKGVQWDTKFLENLVAEKKDSIIKTAINEKEKVLVIVEGNRNNIDWGRFKDISNLIWDLYLVHWDEAKSLLYINSSNNGSLHEALAKEIGGQDALIIKGDQVFRAFYGVNRLIFQNVGLNSARGQAIRYTMYTGIDVEQGLTAAQTGTKFKSNLFGIGFEEGDKASIGCSYKGRIWSRKNSNIAEFIDWCQVVGKKLLDDNINPDEILKNALKRIEITELPNDIYPVSIEWDQGIYDTLLEREIEIISNSTSYNIDDISIELTKVDITNHTLSFKIFNDVFSTEFSLKVFKNKEGSSDFELKVINGTTLDIDLVGSHRPLLDYFREFPPVIRFTDGSFLEGNVFAKVSEAPVLYNSQNIKTLDWGTLGVDITKESQGKSKDADSIQYQLIDQLKQGDYDIIFDDDSSGEIADVIAIKETDDIINIDLFHCKFSSDSTPGARIKDVYEVCGQAQKSIQWRSKGYRIFDHIIRRSQYTKVNGFEKGTRELALSLKNKAKSYFTINFSINIVQPGISKGKITNDMLNILGATETYLKETYMLPLKVISSP